MKPWMIIAAVVLLVAVGIFRTTSGGSEVRDVDVAMVAKGDVRSSVIASGQIAFRQEVQLRSEVIGKVVQLSVEEGDAVLKNQLLMRLDPEAFAQEVEQQTASVRMQEIAIERQEQQIAYLQRQLKRQRSLYKKGSVGEETIETYTHNHSVAKTDLAANRHSLAQANARLATSILHRSGNIVKINKVSIRNIAPKNYTQDYYYLLYCHLACKFADHHYSYKEGQ